MLKLFTFVCKLYANTLFMSIITTVYLDTRRKLKNNQYPIKLRVTYLRKQRYYPTQLSLTEVEFATAMGKNPKGDLFEARVKIDAKLSELRAQIESIHNFSFLKLGNLKIGGSKSVSNIYPFFDEMISICNDRGSAKTAEVYGHAKKSIQNFRSNTGFYDITPDWLRAYEKWMSENGKSLTTTGIYLRHLRAIYNKAITDTIILDKSCYPFKKNSYQIPIGRNIKKALTKEEIKSIANFSDFHSIPERQYRDMWLFSYLSNGMNPNDICRLKWNDIDGDLIRFYRHKTLRTTQNRLPITVYLRSESMDIIERWGDKNSIYIFGVLNDEMDEIKKNKAIHLYRQKVNAYIKQVAESLKMTIVVTSMHARHSFSQVMKNSDVSIEFISESLGHSSLLTTRSYLSSFKDDIMKEASKNLL